MTLNQLIQIASSGYPDNYLATDCWYFQEEEPIDGCGDTLAVFLGRELSDTYSEGGADEDVLTEAIRAVNKAITELKGVVGALELELEADATMRRERRGVKMFDEPDELVRFIEDHGGYWDGDVSEFPLATWWQEARDGNTRLSYWEWAYANYDEHNKGGRHG